MTTMNRRAALSGAAGLVASIGLVGCASIPGFSLTEAVRRMLLLSSERAFARLTRPDGFWDDQVARLGLANTLGVRGDIISGILTSGLFKARLEGAFADVAIEATERAAPVVTDAVRAIGIGNAAAIVSGDRTAATSLLRGELGGRLVEAMVPEIASAMRVANDPLIGQLLNAAVGTDARRVADSLARTVEDTIFAEIGREEAAIRADPRATRDPAIIAVLTGAGALGR